MYKACSPKLILTINFFLYFFLYWHKYPLTFMQWIHFGHTYLLVLFSCDLDFFLSVIEHSDSGIHFHGSILSPSIIKLSGFFGQSSSALICRILVLKHLIYDQPRANLYMVCSDNGQRIFLNPLNKWSTPIKWPLDHIFKHLCNKLVNHEHLFSDFWMLCRKLYFFPSELL